MAHIYPSLISADLLNLENVITNLESYCSGFHLDVMDGHFVPNITWGPAFVNAIAAKTTKACWIHLMTTDPHLWIERLEVPAGSMIDFHIETDIQHKELLKTIRTKKLKAGIAISPKTPIEIITPLLAHLDYVLIMSVKPGFSGQSFMPSALEKMNFLATYRAQHNLTFDICADGGINEHTIREVIAAGSTHIAMASAIFDKPDPINALQKISTLI